MREIKTYRELTLEERLQTWKNFELLCERDGYMESFDTFKNYDEEQMALDMDFDAKTLECLG